MATLPRHASKSALRDPDPLSSPCAFRPPCRRLRLQDQFVRLLSADERFEIVAPPRFGLVCFRVRGSTNEDSELLLEEVNASGGGREAPHSMAGAIMGVMGGSILSRVD
jgi:hypothetical protein